MRNLTTLVGKLRVGKIFPAEMKRKRGSFPLITMGRGDSRHLKRLNGKAKKGTGVTYLLVGGESALVDRGKGWFGEWCRKMVAWIWRKRTTCWNDRGVSERKERPTVRARVIDLEKGSEVSTSGEGEHDRFLVKSKMGEGMSQAFLADRNFTNATSYVENF